MLNAAKQSSLDARCADLLHCEADVAASIHNRLVAGLQLANGRGLLDRLEYGKCATKADVVTMVMEVDDESKIDG